MVQAKPWYFCSLLLINSIGAIIGRAVWTRLPLSNQPRSVEVERQDF
ncbi:hypothetical protein C481_02007 [Natrialba asiatica DSM 12278]|uniref:Uncharacterized protein n=1 Tax=Natrialba asiatica (strain ATCC 700177 / DSM 12278 / JCM 9576 / FERM P-10747 / NBRC 102637 / 172P1) TaxID=29540 RepID=M0B737_NATA1|nr:hypothetical protein C481_02007 [Natrialba asiatica DSM 12278]